LKSQKLNIVQLSINNMFKSANFALVLKD